MASPVASGSSAVSCASSSDWTYSRDLLVRLGQLVHAALPRPGALLEVAVRDGHAEQGLDPPQELSVALGDGDAPA